jgi:uncharacterized protein (DUF2236 family)
VTVKILNLLSDDETVPSTIVPPTEELQDPANEKLAQLATAMATLLPSGTELPLASLIPEKVTVAFPPEETDSEVGPDAVADVIPGSWMVPIAKLVLVSVEPVVLAATTDTPTF